jgi:Sec-independent protein translocase protein TatA
MLERLRSMWAWLEKWGGWLVGPIVTLIVVLLGRRKTPSAVDTTVKDAAEKKTTEAEQAAVVRAEKEKQQTTEAHDAAAAAELQKERETVTQIENDPDKVNDFVVEAGRAARGEK